MNVSHQLLKGHATINGSVRPWDATTAMMQRCMLQGNQHYNYLLKAFADANPNVHYLVPCCAPSRLSS